MEKEKIYVDFVEYPEDCLKIRELLEKKGYCVSLKDCENIWIKYSASFSSSWLIFRTDNNSELIEYLTDYLYIK